MTENSKWVRLAYMVLFLIVLEFTQALIFLLALVSFLWWVFKGKTLEQANSFGVSVSNYVKELILFLTFNQDNAPWPFDTWPSKQ